MILSFGQKESKVFMKKMHIQNQNDADPVVKSERHNDIDEVVLDRVCAIDNEFRSIIY